MEYTNQITSFLLFKILLFLALKITPMSILFFIDMEVAKLPVLDLVHLLNLNFIYLVQVYVPKVLTVNFLNLDLGEIMFLEH